jgi:hypothetical protein
VAKTRKALRLNLGAALLSIVILLTANVGTAAPTIAARTPLGPVSISAESALSDNGVRFAVKLRPNRARPAGPAFVSISMRGERLVKFRLGRNVIVSRTRLVGARSVIVTVTGALRERRKVRRFSVNRIVQLPSSPSLSPLPGQSGSTPVNGNFPVVATPTQVPRATVTPTRTPTPTPTPVPTTPVEQGPRSAGWESCFDGQDNDTDGRIDMFDLDCLGPNQGELPGPRPLSYGMSRFRNTDGFTHFYPSRDSRIVFVSSSTGNDLSDGFSPESPVFSFDRAYELLRDGYPDWILIKRGEYFTANGTLGENGGGFLKSGRSPNEPILVGSYGENGLRPFIRTSDGKPFLMTAYAQPPRNLVVTGLQLDGHNHPWNLQTDGIRMFGAQNVLLENNLFSGWGGAFTFLAGGEGAREPRNIHVYRNVVANQFSKSGAHSQGFFTAGVENLIVEDNVFDKNGCDRSAVSAILTDAAWDPVTRRLTQSGLFGAGSLYPTHRLGDTIKITSGTILRATSLSLESSSNSPNEADTVRGDNSLSAVDGYYNGKGLRLARSDGQETQAVRIKRYIGSTRTFELDTSIRLSGAIDGGRSYSIPIGGPLRVTPLGLYTIEAIESPDAIRLTTNELWHEPLLELESASGGDGQCTKFNRHAYISGGVGGSRGTIVAGNITRAGSSGFVQLRMGGIAVGNVSFSEPAGISLGHAENPVGSRVSGRITSNFLSGSQDINPRDPLGWGISVTGRARRISEDGPFECFAFTDSVTIEDNILQGGLRSTGNAEAITVGECSFGHLVSNNIVYDWNPTNADGSTGEGVAFGRYRNMSLVDSVTVTNNDFQMPNAGLAVKFFFTDTPVIPLGALFFSGNRYAGPPTRAQFQMVGATVGFNEFLSSTLWGESSQPSGEIIQTVAYRDPRVSAGRYAQTNHLGDTEDELFGKLRLRSRNNWSAKTEVRAIHNYLRAGFGRDPVPETERLVADALR